MKPQPFPCPHCGCEVLAPERTHKRPSRSQRGYWHGCVIPAMARAMGHFPSEHDAIHDLVVREVLGYQPLKPGQGPWLRLRVSTSNGAMSDEQYGQLIELGLAWAALNLVDFECEAPDPRWKVSAVAA